MHIVRRNAAAFWTFAERVTEAQKRWPEWLCRAADAEFITPPTDRLPAPSEATR